MQTLAALAPEPPLSPAPPREPERIEVPRPVPAAAPAPVALVTERRRVVIRLVNGDEIDVAEGTEQEETMEQARAVVRLLAEAEAAAEWPEIEGRFLRPSSIVSVDVLVAE